MGVWAAAAAEDGGKGREERRGRSCLKWQYCITSHRGNRRKARGKGKQDSRGGVACARGGEAWHRLVFVLSFLPLKLSERAQRSDQKFLFFNYPGAGVK